MITQNTKNATKYANFWYNGTYLVIIPITYFLIRLMEHMKYGPKNLKRYDGICIKQIEKELDARLKTSGMTFIWSSFPDLIGESMMVKL